MLNVRPSELRSVLPEPNFPKYGEESLPEVQTAYKEVRSYFKDHYPTALKAHYTFERIKASAFLRNKELDLAYSGSSHEELKAESKDLSDRLAKAWLSVMETAKAWKVFTISLYPLQRTYQHHANEIRKSWDTLRLGEGADVDVIAAEAKEKQQVLAKLGKQLKKIEFMRVKAGALDEVLTKRANGEVGAPICTLRSRAHDQRRSFWNKETTPAQLVFEDAFEEEGVNGAGSDSSGASSSNSHASASSSSSGAPTVGAGRGSSSPQGGHGGGRSKAAGRGSKK